MKTAYWILILCLAGCAAPEPKPATLEIDFDALERALEADAAPAPQQVSAPPAVPESVPWTQEELLAMALIEQNRQMAALQRQMADVQPTVSRQTRPLPYNVPMPLDDGQEQLDRWNQQWHNFQEDCDRIQRHNQDVLRRHGNPYAR
jgi:hypothetical protein